MSSQHDITMLETCDTPSNALKVWNPAEDNFFSWCGKLNTAVYVKPNSDKAAFLISIGNCFLMREEAEDEGKWLFQDRLVLDQKLRKCGINPKNVCWSFVRPNLHTLKCEYYTEDFSNKVYAILGTDAKRYLTGGVI